MSKYYNGDKLLSRHYMINMVCGTRAGGKSYFFKRYVLKRTIQDHNAQFALVVKYDKDKSFIAPSYFNDIMEERYKDFTLVYKNGTFYMRDNREGESKAWVCGYCFALNNATKMKSSSYPNINTIILEEFINIEGKYIKNQNSPELEVELLNSLVITIFRGKGKRWRENGKVFLISNAYSLNNPYFRYFNMIDKISKDPFKRFYECRQTPSCIVERTDIEDIDFKINRDSTAQGSKWTDFRNELHIFKNNEEFKPKSIICQVSFDNIKWLTIAQRGDDVFVFKDKKRQCNYQTNNYCFTCSEEKSFYAYNIKIWKDTEQYKNFEMLYLANNLKYDSLETYIDINNIINF